MEHGMSPRARRRFTQQGLIYLSALIVLVVMAFPLYGLLLTSLQPEAVIRSRDVQFVPTSLYLDHFAAVLAPGHIVPIRAGILNSLAISMLTAAVCLIVALPAAYALSRLRLPGKNLMLGAMVSVYFLPTTLFLIPMFVLASTTRISASCWPIRASSSRSRSGSSRPSSIGCRARSRMPRVLTAARTSR
jgi:multiple sugar transport system permease protein